MVRDVHFDRSGSSALLEALKNGPARELIDLARKQPSAKPMYDGVLLAKQIDDRKHPALV